MAQNDSVPMLDFEKFFNLSSDLFMITDNTGIILKVNSEWESILGYSPSEMEGKSYTDFVHPDDVSLSDLKFEVVLATKSDRGFINRYKTRSGEAVHLEWEVRVDGDRHYASARDITSRFKNLVTFSDKMEKFRMVAENSSDVIMRFDNECRHLYTNPAASRVFGFTAEQFYGKNHEELGFKKEDYEFWDDRILKVFATKKPHKEVVPIFNGSMHVDWILEPEFDENGDVASVLSITRDVTEIVELKNKLLNANSELEKFFSIIAHDLRSPFFGFINLTEIMVEEFDELPVDEIKEMQSALLDSARRTYALLSELLNWAVFRRGHMEYEPEMLLLGDVVAERAASLKRNIVEKDISLSINILTDIFVKADRKMLSSVVSNLLGNAVKFTPKGGAITIDANNTENGFVSISFTDTGIGMSERILNNLFKMSEKTGRKGTDGEPTTGLGLLLCKEFIEKMGGSINVKSREGEGSTFTVLIPKE